MECVEKSSIPHGLLRVSHLPNWFNFFFPSVMRSYTLKRQEAVLFFPCMVSTFLGYPSLGWEKRNSDDA